MYAIHVWKIRFFVFFFLSLRLATSVKVDVLHYKGGSWEPMNLKYTGS